MVDPSRLHVDATGSEDRIKFDVSGVGQNVPSIFSAKHEHEIKSQQSVAKVLNCGIKISFHGSPNL